MIEKLDEDASFGFHIKDNQPVIVSTIEEGSPAQRGGLQVGDVLIAVNEVNVLEASHQEVVKLMAAGWFKGAFSVNFMQTGLGLI